MKKRIMIGTAAPAIRVRRLLVVEVFNMVLLLILFCKVEKFIIRCVV